MPRRKRSSKRRPLTTQELMHATLGPRMSALLQTGRPEELVDEWQAWDREHGLRWRLEHRCLHNVDLAELWARAEGVEPARVLRSWERPDPRLFSSGSASAGRPPTIRGLREMLDELLDRLPELTEGAAAPDPPGFEFA